MRTDIAAIKLLTAVVLALSPQLPAIAHDVNTPTSVSIGYSSGAFSGTVSSERARCERGRSVTLIKQRRGNDRVVGSTTSNRQGSWRIGTADASGKFYVRVGRKVSGGYGHSHVCGAATSRKIRV
jgi:hypothetical protein